MEYTFRVNQVWVMADGLMHYSINGFEGFKDLENYLRSKAGDALDAAKITTGIDEFDAKGIPLLWNTDVSIELTALDIGAIIKGLQMRVKRNETEIIQGDEHESTDLRDTILEKEASNSIDVMHLLKDLQSLI